MFCDYYMLLTVEKICDVYFHLLGTKDKKMKHIHRMHKWRLNDYSFI